MMQRIRTPLQRASTPRPPRISNPALRLAVGQTKSFLLIGLVTVLIWLLAEAESLRVDAVRIDLAFRAEAESGRFIVAERGFPGAVSVRLEGSTARVDELAEQLRSKPIRLEPGMEGIPQEPGRHMINLSMVLRNLPIVRESGASIAEVEPPIVSVTVDNLIEREIKVRPEIPDGPALDVPPSTSPATVTLHFPERFAAELPEELQLAAPVPLEALANLPEGRRSTVRDVQVQLPPALRSAEGIRIVPPTVNVDINLRSRTETALLATVPVHVRLAPTETGIWDITMPAESRILTDVTVMGPSDQIQLIRSEKIRPIAYVPVSYDELEKAAQDEKPIEKEPIFCELPMALKFEVKQSQRTVRLHVKRRDQASPPATLPQPATNPPATPR